MALCLENISLGYGLPASLFLAGLAGGFTHCITMCGPFVLAQQPTRSAAPFSLRRLAGNALLPYHFGRMTTYILLAVLFSTALNAALLSSPVKAAVSAMMLFSAAVVFLAAAIPVVGEIFPYLAKLRLPVPQRLINMVSAPLLRSPSIKKRYLLGIVLGFMPCSMVMAALIAAGSLDTPLKSALAMSAFALGTFPALMMTGLGGHFVMARFPQGTRVLKFLMILTSTGVLLLTSGKMIFSQL